MNRTNEPMRWPLPITVHPVGTLCFQIEIPNESAYINAFYGAIWALTYSKNWARDSAHTAAEVSRVWSEIFFKLRPGGCTQPVPDHGGLLEDFEMPLRVDCDCNVFVTCCDGTEKQILTADQVQKLIGQQPGGGTPQPPVGGCMSYHAILPANQQWNLPTVVSTGDTLELSNASGAVQDGSLSPWLCPNGQTFFAGTCIGVGGTSGSDPVPTAFHMVPIIYLNSDPFQIDLGVTFTVPGGYSNAAVNFQVNDPTLSDDSGEFQFDVQVCNNQPAPWTAVLDFRTDPYSDFIAIHSFAGASGPSGSYILGTGYKDSLINYSGINATRSVFLELTATGHYTNIRMDYVASWGSFDPPYTDASIIFISNPGSAVLIESDNPATPASPQGWVGEQDSTSALLGGTPGEITGAGDPGGSMVLTVLTITGTGPNPFA